MTATSIFGPLITPDQVIRTVETQVRTWSRAYLDYAAQGRGFSRRLPSIASIRRVNTRPETWPEDILPCVVLVTEDATDLARDGEGNVSVTQPVGVAVVHSTRDQDSVNKAVRTIGTALMLMFEQKPVLGSPQIAEVIEVLPYAFGEMTPENDRRLAALSFGLLVQVPDAWNGYGGPAVPTPDDVDPIDYGNTPTAETIDVTQSNLA